jgi:phage gp29-like protein
MTLDERKGVVWPVPAQYRTNDFDLSNVTPEQVRTILRNVRTGKLEDQDRLFRLMLDTWPRLRKALNEIAGAVAKLEIEIKPGVREDAEDPTPEAQRIYEVTERALESYAPRPGYWELDMEGAVRALIDAYAKGISVLEIVWQSQNGVISPRCYAPVPAKYLAYPSDSGTIDRLMVAPNGVTYSKLEDFPPDRFLIGIWSQGGMHPIHAANLRTLTKYWLASVYGLGWLMQFAQLFGIPWRHVETDGSEAALTAAETMLEQIGASGWAATGPGVKLNLLEGVKGTADSLPQYHLLDIADRACDVLLLGQTLTTDNTGTGSRALGDVHMSIRTEVLQNVGSWVAQIVTNQLIPAIVRHNFGARVASEDMPYAEIVIPAVKDAKATAERFKILVESGVEMPRKWVYEELEIPEPQADDAIFGRQDEPILDLESLQAARADIDFRPTDAMAKNAQAALDTRRQKPASQRGMTAVGLARARDIANRTELSEDTVRRMVSFFARHEVDKEGITWDQQGKGWQAWNGWGGDEGWAWAKRIVERLDANDQ